MNLAKGTQNRENWTFVYTAGDLIAACAERLVYHHGRHSHWENEIIEAEKALQAKGLEFRYREYTGGAAVEIVGDPELAKHCATCQSSMNKHQMAIERMERWKRLFEHSAIAERFELTQDDAEAFGL